MKTLSIEALAGPRVVEHLVDVVLMFEGDRQHPFRTLRGIKNRFGATNELGLFAMEGEGLVAVEDPSRSLLAERPLDAAGSAVVAAIEGTRPILVEVQALLVRSYGTPRRVVSGLDPHRAALVLAVMERHLGVRISEMDAYFKLTGGVSLDDPGIDLGILCAALSSIRGIPVAPEWVVAGEVGLTGELRRVGRIADRLKEAQSLGFKRGLIPGKVAEIYPGIAANGVVTVSQAAIRLGLNPDVNAN
jgi:DNA repair protein RadA/Sms